MNTNEGLIQVERRHRRHHSAEFKAQAVAACQLPGVSIASIALSNGINANLLRRWVLAAEGQSGPRPSAPAAFVQLQIEQSRSTPESIPALPTPTTDIRIELRRGTFTVNIAWPLAESAACATWMRELLR